MIVVMIESTSMFLALGDITGKRIGAPELTWMPQALDPLLHSGILLAAIAAVLLNLFFNGMSHDTDAAIKAAKQAEGGH